MNKTLILRDTVLIKLLVLQATRLPVLKFFVDIAFSNHFLKQFVEIQICLMLKTILILHDTNRVSSFRAVHKRRAQSEERSCPLRKSHYLFNAGERQVGL